MDDLEKAKAKSGWQKIEYICRQALEDGLQWAWVDTCCIDKSSSAELSEAINSMFKWHECSTVCYVYLCDVTMTAALRDDAPTVSEWLERADRRAPVGPTISSFGRYSIETLWRFHVGDFRTVIYEIMSGIKNDHEGYTRPCNELDISLIDTLGAFSTAKWWSRGWTLQELLAPRNLVFMDQHWQQIARLPELVVTVSTITSVDVEVLLKTAPLKSRCIAERLSWASKRSTTREEDTAYALLGIFDANMPLLYGEGSRAFERLQEVISLRSNDLSIYAWLTLCPEGGDLAFAASPSYFVDCVAVRKRSWGSIAGISASPMGITFTTLFSRIHGYYFIDLGCYIKFNPALQIVLMVMPREGLFEKWYSRLRWKVPLVYTKSLVATEMEEAFAQKSRPRSLTIVPCPTIRERSSMDHAFAALLTVHLAKELRLPVEGTSRREFWNLHTNQLHFIPGDIDFPLEAGLEFKGPDGHVICLALRLSHRYGHYMTHWEKLNGSSAIVSGSHYSYECLAELVPDLPLSQACTQSFATLYSRLTDEGIYEHSNDSQNKSRLSLGGKHLAVEVVAGEDLTTDNGLIMFDIFIHARTPTTEENREKVRRRPWLERKARKRESAQSRSYRGTIAN